MQRGLRALEPVAFALPAAGFAAASLWIAYAFGPFALLAAAGASFGLAVAAFRPVWGVLLGILLIPTELASVGIAGGAGLSATEAMLALSGLSWGMHRLAAGHVPFVTSPLTKPLALMLLAVVPGLIVAVDPFTTVKILLMWTCFFLVVQMFLAEGDPKSVETLLVTLTITVGIVGLTAIAGSAGHEQSLTEGGTQATGRAVGTFAHPNSLASFLSMGLPVALAVGVSGPAKFRLVALASFVAALLGLTLSLSRGGLLGAGAALVVLCLWKPFRRIALSAIALFILTAAIAGTSLLSGSQVIDRVTHRLESVRYSAKGEDPRATLWRALPGIIEDHPLVGVGAGQFPFVVPRYGLKDPFTGSPFSHAHNIAFTITAELGLLGLIALIWMATAIAQALVRACRWNRGPPKSYAFALAAALIGMAVQGMVDYTIRSNVIGALVLLLAAAAVVLSTTEPVAEQEPAS